MSRDRTAKSKPLPAVEILNDDELAGFSAGRKVSPDLPKSIRQGSGDGPLGKAPGNPKRIVAQGSDGGI